MSRHKLLGNSRDGTKFPRQPRVCVFSQLQLSHLVKKTRPPMYPWTKIYPHKNHHLVRRLPLPRSHTTVQCPNSKNSLLYHGLFDTLRTKTYVRYIFYLSIFKNIRKSMIVRTSGPISQGWMLWFFSCYSLNRMAFRTEDVLVADHRF